MTCVYRHFDKDGKLLYIGQSVNPIRRLEEHEYQSQWASEIAQVTIERYNSYEKALRVEELAIKREDPIYNKKHKENISLIRKRARAYGPKTLKGQALTDWENHLRDKAAIAAGEPVCMASWGNTKKHTLAQFLPKDEPIG